MTKTTTRQALYWFFLVTLLVAGCDQSPTGPTPTPTPPAPRLNLTGAWSGQLSLTLDGQRATTASNGELTQVVDRVTGLLSNRNGSRILIDGQLSSLAPDAVFTGTVRLETTSSDSSVTCVSTASNLTGPVSPSITLSAPTLMVTNCDGVISDFTLSLSR